MKKRLIAIVVAVAMCLAVLSGCSLLKSLEKDVNVVFEIDGVYQAGVTVNTFNNAIAPKFDEDAEGAVPDGYKFMGWAAKHDWKYGDDRDLLISSEGIVRYDAVKNYVNEGGTAIAVPIIIDRNTIPRGDVVIAWYSNNKNSGLDESSMASFETELRAYLATEGYDVSKLEIVIRSYGGNVGPSCENIRRDGDVDIMLGWANTNNLTGTGSMKPGRDVFENASNIKIGETARYAALCVDRELGDREISIKVYDWIREKYVAEGKQSVLENLKPTVTEPDPEPPVVDPDPVDPSDKTKLVIGWYAKTNTTGLDQTKMDNFEAAMKEFLKVAGYKLDELDIQIREYDTKLDVAGVGTAVNKDGDVDILLGMGGNITSTGKIETLDLVDYTINKKNRNIARLSDNEIGINVFRWMQTDVVKAIFA